MRGTLSRRPLAAFSAAAALAHPGEMRQPPAHVSNACPGEIWSVRSMRAATRNEPGRSLL
eukprot:4551137-Prymnesium_polylepis.1